jgi:hypothetical protein
MHEGGRKGREREGGSGPHLRFSYAADMHRVKILEQRVELDPANTNLHNGEHNIMLEYRCTLPSPMNIRERFIICQHKK